MLIRGGSIFLFILLVGAVKQVGCSNNTRTDYSNGFQELALVGNALRSVDFSITSVYKHVTSLSTHSLLGYLPAATLPYTTCAASLLDLLNGTKAFEMWALKMIDASTKIPSGLLEGNLIDLGQFDECVNVDRSTNENAPYVGQHCLVQLVLSMPNLANVTIEVNGVPIRIVDLLGGTKITLTISQCLPSSCKPFMVEKAYSYIFFPVNVLVGKKNITLNAVVDTTDCHVKDRGPLKTEDWVVAAICVGFIFIAVAATAVHILLIGGREPTPTERLILAFSIKANAKKLFGTKTNTDQMGAINGMKFFSIAWVVLGHRYRYSVQQPLVNLLELPDMMRNWTKMFLLNATLSVDTFFLISGLLNAYGFFTMMTKKRRYTIIDLIVTYVHRYIRLSPAYMIMIAITGTWLYRVGDGPLWDRLVGSARDNCQVTWWSNIIYLNNYLNPDQNCMMQSWYLAADMQMFWLAPFVLYPMWRWPIFGLIELFILTCLSIATPIAIAYIYDIREPIPLTNDVTKQSREMDMLYLPTHTKTIAYVVGIFAGWLLQKARTKKIKLPFNLVTLIIGWILCAILLLYALFGCYWLFQSDNPYTLLESSLYLGFYRFFWAVGVTWVLLTCIMGYGGFVNSFLSWKQFGPLGRLTYCIYLTHIAVVLYKMGSIRTAMFLEDYGQVEQFIGDLFFSLITATILTLLLESPILTVEKMIFGGGGRGRSEPRRVEQPPPQTEPLTQAQPVSENNNGPVAAGSNTA